MQIVSKVVTGKHAGEVYYDSKAYKLFQESGLKHFRDFAVRVCGDCHSANLSTSTDSLIIICQNCKAVYRHPRSG